MPINISTVPKKRVTKPKKQEDAARVYKNNRSGPDPNAPQPPSPDSDVTDTDGNDVGNDANDTASSGSSPGATTATTNSITPITSIPSKKKSQKEANEYDRLEVNRLLSDLFPSNYMNQKLKQLESAAAAAADSTKKTNAKTNAKPNAKTNAKTNANANATAIKPNEPNQDHEIMNAIIENAFSGTESPILPPPTTPPPSTAQNVPMAPKKAVAAAAAATTTSTKKNEKSKQNFNIIIHVEPKPQEKTKANDSISRRLDFGKKQITHESENHDVSESDDSDDEDYIPGGDSDDEEYWEDDDEEYDDDSDDDSYYSSSDDDDDDDDLAALEDLQEKYTDELAMMQSLRATYEEILSKDKTNRVISNQLKTLKESEEKIKKELDELTYKQKRKNSKRFRKLLRRKSSTNDMEYFKKHLTIQQQRALIDEMNEVAKVTAIEKPYKLTLLESDIPRDMKAVALRKVGMLQYMEPGCGEYCKLKNWVDAFMQIPFNKNKNLPITIADGVDKCHEFMTAAKTRLDAAVYGLNDAKMQIMQMVGQWIANPDAIGTAVAIHGPPGTGKTSLVKEGISKILGRDFAFIALGGATDSSFLEGHSYTYEGSVWGKIVDFLIRCKSSNPVIYFDELDKISETSKGEEIVGILTHLTDTSQNSQFHDKYFSEVAFDLSKCLFIFSYNDESRVNPVLLDRMYKIRTTGYSTKDKTFIAQHHLIPRIRAEVAFAEGDIIIPDSVVEYIVENHTLKEAGVRNLKRCLETVYTKLNLHRLMRPGTQLFDNKETSLEVSFPYTVSREVMDKLIKKNDSDRPNMNLYL